MTELKIQIDDSIIKSFGKEVVEHFVQDYIANAILKLAAKEVLEDLHQIDINESKWDEARERAWKRSGYHFINVIANA
ncbi:MAG: hypothetical protein B6D61_07015 [Bacteroidetes bacterium 4484_249]|nr:MAG: hypothetical protein B6D61_07015 [Bacteroidetes bacterium 4484_249]